MLTFDIAVTCAAVKAKAVRPAVKQLVLDRYCVPAAAVPIVIGAVVAVPAPATGAVNVSTKKS